MDPLSVHTDEALPPQAAIATLFADEATFSCLKCHSTLAIPRGESLQADQLNLQCPCGIQYQVYGGHRRYERKTVKLHGTYIGIRMSEPSGEMTIENISFGGLRMRTSEPAPFETDDCLFVHFVLDDAFQTPVTELIRVRYVEDEHVIGAQFENSEAITEALAAYLMQ